MLRHAPTGLSYAHLTVPSVCTLDLEPAPLPAS
jgi:hypothetical protein